MKCSCPACDAPLRLSDDLPPGKRVRCPECDELFTIPARGKGPVRPKSRPKQTSGSGDLVLWGGLGLLVLALVAGGIALAVGLSRPSDPKPNQVAAAPNPTPAPAPTPQPQPQPQPEPQPSPPPPAEDPNAVAVRPTVRPEERERERDPEPLPPVGLEIGKLAPEIEGEDIDGKFFKLSDYRGKVVVLDFWGHW